MTEIYTLLGLLARTVVGILALIGALTVGTELLYPVPAQNLTATISMHSAHPWPSEITGQGYESYFR